MLVLTRRKDESIVIGDEIVITVLAVEGDKVKLGIDAPRRISVLRRELWTGAKDPGAVNGRHASEGHTSSAEPGSGNDQR